MIKNLKIFAFVMTFIMLVSVACGGTPTPPPTPTEIPTQVPTQTALPTYTPMPTYTPYPTPTHASIPTQEPTSVPDNDTNMYAGIPAPEGIKAMTCPNTDLPVGVSSAECYSLNNKGLGIVYLDSSGAVWGVGVSYFQEDELAFMSGQFLAWGGMTHGMEGSDIVGALQSIKEPDTWYTYNTVKVKASIGDGKVAFVIKPSD